MPDRTSYLAAAGGPTGLTDGIAELETLRQNLSNNGGPSRGPLINRPQNNVIIPTTGAANYWYVDPRASGTPGSMPINHTDLEQQALYRADPNRYSPPHEDQMPPPDFGTSPVPTDLANRTPRPSPVNLVTPEQRASVYGTIGVKIGGEEQEVPLWHKGMTAPQAEDAARMRFEHDLSAFAPEKDLVTAQRKWLQESARMPQSKSYFSF